MRNLGFGILAAAVLVLAGATTTASGSTSGQAVQLSPTRAAGIAGLLEGSASYDDGVSDTEGTGSPDIGRVAVANSDYGDVAFGITLVNQRAFNAGDFLVVFIDADRNRGTGSSGADWAIGIDQQRNVYFYVWNGSQFASQFVPSQSDEPTGTNSHQFAVAFRVVNPDGSLKNADFSFDFNVVAAHFDASDNLVGRDQAPGGGGYWTYNARITPDYDGDKLRGADDKCPRTRQGRYGKKDSGCPAKFAEPSIKNTNKWQVVGRSVKWTSFKIRNKPPGATVVILVNRRQVRGLVGRVTPVGTQIVVTFARRDTIGAFVVYRVSRSGALKKAGSGCTKLGKSKPGPCKIR